MLVARAFFKGKKFYVPLLIVSLLVVFAVAAANHLWNQTSSGSSIETVEAIQYPVKLVMELNKTTYSPGETVNITFRVENIGNETLTLDLFRDYVDFSVYDGGGIQVFSLSHYLVEATVWIEWPYDLEPSEVRVYRTTPDIYVWKQFYYESEAGPNYQQVKAGRYYIVGQFISFLP